MLSKSFYKLRILLLLTEVIARLYIWFLQVHSHWCIADSASEVLPKNPTSLYARCVCVYHLNRCKTSDWFSLVCRGRQGRCMSGCLANEACTLLDMESDQTPRTCKIFSDIARGQAKNPNHNIIQFAALLSQSGINFVFTCIRTFLRFSPKPYRRQYYDFLTYFRRDHVADELWVILGNNRRNIIVDSQHAG